MTTPAKPRVGDLVRLHLWRHGAEVVGTWCGFDGDLACLQPIDRPGRLYVAPPEIRAVEVVREASKGMSR